MKKSLPQLFLSIFILPFITFIASFLFRSVSGPFWQYGDSSYNYFFNGLLIVKGHAPVVIAHPGTPLQVLIALTVWVLNIGSTGPQALDRALIDPEFYLQAVFIILAVGSFLTSVLSGIYIYRKTNDKLAVLLSQLMPLSFLVLPSFDAIGYPVLPVVANVNAEPVFIILMNLFNLFLFGLYFSKEETQELRHTFLLALICGLGLAVKLNFLFILLAALTIVPFRKKLLFIAVFAASFVLGTLPIIGKYPQLFQWVTDIITHSSRYGTGSKGFIDQETFLYNLKLTLHADWFFVCSVLGLWIWSSIQMIKGRLPRAIYFIWVLCFFCILHILATAKHFSFHYLLPGLALLSAIFPLFYLSQVGKSKALRPLISVFILIFVTTVLCYAVPYYERLQVLSQDIGQFDDELRSKYPPCTIIPSTTVDIGLALNEQQAMLSANGATFRLMGDDLFRLYPKSYYFFSEEVSSPDPSVESYGLWNYKESVFADDIIHTSPCAIFVKYHTEDLSAYPFQVHLIGQSKYLNAYLLVSSAEKLADYLFGKSMEAFDRGDFKQAFMLGVECKKLNYEPKGQLEYFLNLCYQNLIKQGGSH